jgi:hypothetical protein
MEKDTEKELLATLKSIDTTLSIMAQLLQKIEANTKIHPVSFHV